MLLALLGLVLTLSGPVVYLAAMDDNTVLTTGLPLFALLGAGTLAGVVAAGRHPRRLTRGLAVGEVVLTIVVVVAFFGLAQLAEPDRGRTARRAPAFTLPDHTGRPGSLAAELERGPVHLVFYRGHW